MSIAQIQDWALSWEISISDAERTELIDELTNILINSKTSTFTLRQQLKELDWYSPEMEQAFNNIKEQLFIYNKNSHKKFEIAEIIFQNNEIIVGKLGIPNISENDKTVTILKSTGEVLHRKLQNYFII